MSLPRHASRWPGLDLYDALPRILLSKHWPLCLMCIGRRLLTTHSEWVAHHHRDTYATIIGLPSLLSYAAMADGEAPQRVKFEYCEVRSSASIGRLLCSHSASEAAPDLHVEAADPTQRMLAPIGPPPETVRARIALHCRADAAQED